VINCFLLFHKCGNNYVQNVHRIDTATIYINSVKEHEAANIIEYDKSGTVVNVRCRNFNYETIKTSGLLNIESARFLIFTRDPASFIFSAAKYHLRGSEKWAVKEPQQSLDGKTLTQALREATSPDEQQIIIMKQFDWLYESQVSLLKYINDPNFFRVRCEDIFTTTEEAYFSNIASFLRCSKRPSFITSLLRRSKEPSFLYALKVASPAFKNKLPKHSTGSFKIENPYHALGGKAKSFYDAHWMEYAQALDYDCGDK
jgi:hypothetical protein